MKTSDVGLSAIDLLRLRQKPFWDLEILNASSVPPILYIG